jgi:predicted Zn-dependent protease with MMP-like domain
MDDSQKAKPEEEDEDQEQEQEATSDPRIEAGWRALDAGDVASARQAARSAIEGEGEGKDRTSDDLTGESARLDGLLLSTACAREEGNIDEAIDTLARAAREDPDWCTPELWTAELLAEDPDQLSEALRHARRALDRAEEEEEYLAALACKAAIELDLGRADEARRTLDGLPAADVSLGDATVTLEIAELLMDAGDPSGARARLEALVATEPGEADAWYLLGGAAEMTGDEDAKRAAWARTRTLDIEADVAAAGPTDGRRLSEEKLIAVAEETLQGLPDDLRVHLKNVPIVVAEVPAAPDVATGLDPRLLGLFSGTPHATSNSVLEPPTLTEIILFRRNIERVADDEEIWRDEVRTTLLHEAGHFFGLDEAALTRLGLD